MPQIEQETPNNEGLNSRICEGCQKADVYRDLGYPEEVYYHCYGSECTCGCVNRAADAARIMSRNFFRMSSERKPRV